jgi:glycosyltransferase involved in cell wall biosynthesis
VKLAVTTICPHVFHEGRWWSYEPFVLEMNVWAELFERLIVVAPVEHGPPPGMWAPYLAPERIEVIPYRRDRGRGLEQDRTSPLELPRMAAAVVRAARRADAFHVRCPGSIGLVSAVLAPLLRRRRIAKYAGQWMDYEGEARTVRLQKRILRSRWWGAPVTVYGAWPDQPEHVLPFFSSVLGGEQMQRAVDRMARMTERERSSPPRILFVGRLAPAKNVDVLIDALAELHREGIDLPCTVVGDGPELGALRERAAAANAAGLDGLIDFAGGLPFDRVLDLYETHDVLVLVSESEGWPKAIAEAMAFGLVCIGSDRGLMPQMLGEGRGIVVPARDAGALGAALRRIAADPEAARAMRERAAPWAQRYSLDGLRDGLREITARWWKD